MARQSTHITWKQWQIHIQKKAIKNLILKLNHKGEFKLSLPYFYPLEKLEGFLEKNEKWLENAWQNYQNNAKKEDEIHFLGKKYKLILDSHLTKTKISKTEIKTPSLENLQDFLKQNARIIFNAYLKKWQKRTKLRVKRVSLKTMQTRWGSCNAKKSYINLNLKLIEKPLKAIEYVILHEIAHLKFANHGKEFYAFLLEHMQDFRERERRYFNKFAKI